VLEGFLPETSRFLELFAFRRLDAEIVIRRSPFGPHPADGRAAVAEKSWPAIVRFIIVPLCGRAPLGKRRGLDRGNIADSGAWRNKRLRRSGRGIFRPGERSAFCAGEGESGITILFVKLLYILNMGV